MTLAKRRRDTRERGSISIIRLFNGVVSTQGSTAANPRPLRMRCGQICSGEIYPAADEGECYHVNNRHENPAEAYTRLLVAQILADLSPL
jgi:hypothetical protein